MFVTLSVQQFCYRKTTFFLFPVVVRRPGLSMTADGGGCGGGCTALSQTLKWKYRRGSWRTRKGISVRAIQLLFFFYSTEDMWIFDWKNRLFHQKSLHDFIFKCPLHILWAFPVLTVKCPESRAGNRSNSTSPWATATQLLVVSRKDLTL